MNRMAGLKIKEVTVSAFEYLPRAEEGAPGSVKSFKLFIKK